MGLKTKLTQAQHIVKTDTADNLNYWVAECLNAGWEIKWAQVLKIDPYENLLTCTYILVKNNE